MRVANGGDIGTNDGGYGDLYLEVSVKKHKVFERDGDDLILPVMITYPQAVLGGEIKVQNLMKKEVKVIIPKGSKDGTIVSLNDEGMPILGGRGYGKLRVVLNIDVPKKLSSKQKELLEELQKSFEKDSNKKGFFDNLFSL